MIYIMVSQKKKKVEEIVYDADLFNGTAKKTELVIKRVFFAAYVVMVAYCISMEAYQVVCGNLMA